MIEYLDPGDISKLFINSFIEIEPATARSEKDFVDIEYKHNKFNFRGDGFEENTKMLSIGCSNTYGSGLPYENIWPSLLANKLNLDFSNLAQPGDSASIQVMKAFYYFEKFGNPEIVVALFPMFRLPFVFTENKLKGMVENVDLSLGKIKKYSKAPHKPKNVLTREFSFFYDSVMIDILRQYCISNNIKLVWSVWHPHYQDSVYNEINKFYPDRHKDYCIVEAFNWTEKESNEWDFYGDHNALRCHNEYRSQELFYRAADRLDSNSKTHWGIHVHMHIAEAFYKKIINKLN
jgi:hypothetical protein